MSAIVRSSNGSSSVCMFVCLCVCVSVCVRAPMVVPAILMTRYLESCLPRLLCIRPIENTCVYSLPANYVVFTLINDNIHMNVYSSGYPSH